MNEDVTSTPETCRLQAYDLHGLRIAFESDAPLGETLRQRLEQLPPAVADTADITFAFKSVAGPEEHTVDLPPREARLIYASDLGEFRYDDDTGALYIVCGRRVRARCDAALGTVRISVAGMEASGHWLLSHPMVTVPLMETAKYRGLFSLHAGGVARAGVCLVFPGVSGSGKSTLTLALARAGWDLLGDDMLFLAPGRDGPLVRAFPEPIDVTDRTVGLFADLADLSVAPLLPGWPKRQLNLTDRYDTRVAPACRPAALIFPRVVPGDRSTLRPISRDEAMMELVPNVLLTDADASQKHLDALALLVGQCASYRMETGSDLNALPALLEPLVA